MFNEIKEELTRKICELRLWLSNINDSDDCFPESLVKLGT